MTRNRKIYISCSLNIFNIFSLAWVLYRGIQAADRKTIGKEAIQVPITTQDNLISTTDNHSQRDDIAGMTAMIRINVKRRR
jgi:hypothetical protein